MRVFGCAFMSSVLLSDCIAGKKFEINCLLLSQQYRELDLKAGKKKKFCFGKVLNQFAF